VSVHPNALKTRVEDPGKLHPNAHQTRVGDTGVRKSPIVGDTPPGMIGLLTYFGEAAL
jgi:hypothetical protein